jgi:hypothetical protein
MRLADVGVTAGGIHPLGPAVGLRPPTPHPPDAVSPSPPAAQPPPNSAPEGPEPPESVALPRRWLGLDRLGVLQVLGGIALSLIALFSSYDHINVFGRTLQLQQQWGIPFIAASLATIVVDAELATGSRLRAAQDAARMADEAARERNKTDRERDLASEERIRADQERHRADKERHRADQDRRRSDQERKRSDQERKRANRERNLADRERNRAAQARECQVQAAERQGESLEDIRRAVLLSARVQLDPTASNRARLQTFLSLMGQRPLEGDG